MEYTEYLAQILSDYCPFCDLEHQYPIEKGKYFYVTAARAPYTQNHLLVISKRHVLHIQDLQQKEEKELWALTDKRTKKLEMVHDACTILLRNGIAGGKISKSIDHLHLHIVPDCEIGALHSERRQFFSEKQYLGEIKRIKDKFSKT